MCRWEESCVTGQIRLVFIVRNCSNTVGKASPRQYRSSISNLFLPTHLWKSVITIKGKMFINTSFLLLLFFFFYFFVFIIFFFLCFLFSCFLLFSLLFLYLRGLLSYWWERILHQQYVSSEPSKET